MSGIKKFFSTPVKAFGIVIIIVIVVLLIGLGAAFAYRTVAKNQSIGESQAEQIALSDSGENAAGARFDRTEFTFEDGEFVYEVEFFTDYGEYEYTVAASDGKILERDIDRFSAPLKNPEVSPRVPSQSTGEASRPKSETVPNSESTMNNGNPNTVSGDIGLDRAKEIALEHAGLNGANVIFKEAKLDYDDGLMVYEIEFIYGQDEYEYKIQASDGKVLEYDMEHNNAEHYTEERRHNSV